MTTQDNWMEIPQRNGWTRYEVNSVGSRVAFSYKGSTEARNEIMSHILNFGELPQKCKAGPILLASVQIEKCLSAKFMRLFGQKAEFLTDGIRFLPLDDTDPKG